LILKLLEASFGARQVMHYDEFLRATLSVTSDLYFSLMSVLHTQLACSHTIFSLKRKV